MQFARPSSPGRAGGCLDGELFREPWVDETILHRDVTDTLEVGFLSPAHDNGNSGTSTFTVDATNGAIQKLTNTGAHAWAAPADGTSVIVRVINGTGAGTIDISAFAGHSGDDFDSVVGNKFWASVSAAGTEGIISIVADEGNS